MGLRVWAWGIGNWGLEKGREGPGLCGLGIVVCFVHFRTCNDDIYKTAHGH